VEPGRLGYPESFVRALFAPGPGEIVAVRFRPVSAFAQTPGPRAGARLGQ
jgi:hypothetical protein